MPMTDEVRRHFSEMGKRGGKALFEAMSAEKRTELAKRANDKRWQDRRAKVAAGEIVPKKRYDKRGLRPPATEPDK